MALLEDKPAKKSLTVWGSILKGAGKIGQSVAMLLVLKSLGQGDAGEAQLADTLTGLATPGIIAAVGLASDAAGSLLQGIGIRKRLGTTP